MEGLLEQQLSVSGSVRRGSFESGAGVKENREAGCPPEECVILTAQSSVRGFRDNESRQAFGPPW